MKNRHLVAIALITAPLTTLSVANAETGLITDARINRVMINTESTDVNYGGCMIAIDKKPTDTLPTCPGWWLTFSCTGDFGTSQVQAYRMLDQAQLALATGRRVDIRFRDDMTHNGYCYAYELTLKR